MSETTMAIELCSKNLWCVFEESHFGACSKVRGGRRSDGAPREALDRSRPKSEGESTRLLRELWEAVQAPLNWQDGNDAVSDFARECPIEFERVCAVMIEVHSYLSSEHR